MENKLNTWINAELGRRGWGYNELARRAGISGGTLSNVMAGRHNPGLDFCKGIAHAFDERPERVLRLARLLPAVPPAVEEEEEVIRLLRRLSDQVRTSAIAMLQGLAGMSRARTQAVSEPVATYEAEPRTVSEWLAKQIEEGLETMPLEDQQAVFDFMKRLQDKERKKKTRGAPLEP